MRIRTVKEVERDHILMTLYALEGNVSQAAAALGLSIRGLRLKLIEYRLLRDWVIPCGCQFGRKYESCANHRVDLTPHPDELKTALTGNCDRQEHV